MIRNSLFLLLVCIFLSCKKEKATPQAEEVPDKIEFKTLSPGILLSSVNGNVLKAQDASGPFSIYLPVDTIASDSLTAKDIAFFSLKVTALNYRDESFSTPSSVHNSYILRLQIKGLAPGDSLLKPGMEPNIKLFSEGEVVGPGFVSGSFAMIHSTGGYGFVYGFPAGVSYLGIKRTEGSQNYYGWIKVEGFGPNGIKIKEIAMNRAPGKTIRCGQTN